MYRLRHHVFHERLRWQVRTRNGRERDSFDDLDPVYVIGCHTESGAVTASLRMLPTTGPYMLRDVFPQALRGAPAPCDPQTWEISRLCVHLSSRSRHQRAPGPPSAPELEGSRRSTRGQPRNGLAPRPRNHDQRCVSRWPEDAGPRRSLIQTWRVGVVAGISPTPMRPPRNTPPSRHHSSPRPWSALCAPDVRHGRPSRTLHEGRSTVRTVFTSD
ncbi:acyl-homoserine-lactone synthase [Kitasatospora sp. KL5]|uniref:acyl-homoserine-lactone synthase n=1 Tax=Kitasatospora sp. KL5 TaxID=3425125 RepID=UPI003D6E23C8